MLSKARKMKEKLASGSRIDKCFKGSDSSAPQADLGAACGEYENNNFTQKASKIIQCKFIKSKNSFSGKGT